MYIQPNSTVELFGLIPLDNTYENTLYFESVTAQNTFFTNWSKSKLSVGNALYRVEPTKNSIKIQHKYEDVYKFSYMRFKNSSYENKWFYAFITKVEYVDNITSRVHYEIDVMQTWLPNEDYNLGSCLVEREHSATDEIGDNLITENFSCSDYVVNETYSEFLRNEFEKHCFIIIAISDTDNPSASCYDRVYSGANLYAFDCNDETEVAEIRSFLMQYSSTPEKILSVYTAPRMSVGSVYDRDTHLINPNACGGFKAWAIPKGVTEVDALDGYVPKNKKCYTYPFNYGNVVTSNGDSMCVKYEYFHNSSGDLIPPAFRIDSTITQPVQVCLRPIWYKNSSFEDPLLTNKLTLSSFPTCAWNTDSYKAYKDTQQGFDVFETIVSTVLGAAVTVGGLALASTGVGATGGVPMIAGGVSMAVGGISSIANSTEKMVKNNAMASMHDTQSSGVSNTANVDFSRARYGFTFYRFSVNQEVAKMVDNYFQMYGYACGKVKVPNIKVRQWWTYTKTVGCNITVSSLAVEDKNKIQSIFDKGIRFFTNVSAIGMYQLDNNPT